MCPYCIMSRMRCSITRGCLSISILIYLSAAIAAPSKLKAQSSSKGGAKPNDRGRARA
jgi:hypothetical protein